MTFQYHPNKGALAEKLAWILFGVMILNVSLVDVLVRRVSLLENKTSQGMGRMGMFSEQHRGILR